MCFFGLERSCTLLPTNPALAPLEVRLLKRSSVRPAHQHTFFLCRLVVYSILLIKSIIMSMSADPFRIVLMPILRVDLRFLPEAPKRVFEEYAKERSAYFWSSNIPNSGCFRPPRPTLAGMEEVALLLPPCAWHGYRTVHAITAFLRRACLQLNVNLRRRQCST